MPLFNPVAKPTFGAVPTPGAGGPAGPGRRFPLPTAGGTPRFGLPQGGRPFGPPTGGSASSGGIIPSTQPFNPFIDPSTGQPIGGRKDLNFGTILEILSGAFPYLSGNQDAFRTAANNLLGDGFLTSPLMKSLTSGAEDAMKPVVSAGQLSSMQGAARDRVAREGADLQARIGAQLAGQGQIPGMENPAFVGAAYNTAFGAGQAEIEQALRAAEMNQSGLLGALGAGSGILGAQAFGVGKGLDVLGEFSQADTRFIDLLVALLGAKLGSN